MATVLCYNTGVVNGILHSSQCFPTSTPSKGAGMSCFYTLYFDTKSFIYLLTNFVNKCVNSLLIVLIIPFYSQFGEVVNKGY